MTPDTTSTYAAQATVRRAVRAGRVIFTSHAKRRMEERGADRADVYAALMHGTVAPNLSGPDSWVAIADVIVSIEIHDDPRVIIITVIV